jgi:hypothetical protein
MKAVSVKHLEAYKLEVMFSNGKSRVVDMENFILKSRNPMTAQFRDIELFKQARIERGNVTWLDNEMDISSESLYNWVNEPEMAL